MGGREFDQDRAGADQGAAHKAKSNALSPRGQKIGKISLVAIAVLVIGYYIFDLNFYRTIDCTVTSAEASGGGGGLRSAGSYQRAYIQTEECGEIIFVEMQNEGFTTTQDLADELNRHKGETLTFRVSYLDFGNYEARAVELEGHPIRD